jgi:hypothetical protein
MVGFECSTFVWKDGERKDYIVATGHDHHLQRDLAAAMDLGIGVVARRPVGPMSTLATDALVG